jgi:hypothetical protein
MTMVIPQVVDGCYVSSNQEIGTQNTYAKHI